MNLKMKKKHLYLKKEPCQNVRCNFIKNIFSVVIKSFYCTQWRNWEGGVAPLHILPISCASPLTRLFVDHILSNFEEENKKPKTFFGARVIFLIKFLTIFSFSTWRNSVILNLSSHKKSYIFVTSYACLIHTCMYIRILLNQIVKTPFLIFDYH